MNCLCIFVSIEFSFAIFPGHTDVVRALIELGANVNAEAINKTTPLHIAAIDGTSYLFIYFISFYTSHSYISYIVTFENSMQFGTRHWLNFASFFNQQ